MEVGDQIPVNQLRPDAFDQWQQKKKFDRKLESVKVC
jgi:hypothetical protein